MRTYPTSFTSSPVTDGSYQAAGAKPAAHVYDAAGAVQIATVDPGKVNLNGNGTVTIDLTTLPAGVTTGGNYSVKAVDGSLYLDPSGTTVSSVGSGYAAVPGFQVVAPDGNVIDEAGYFENRLVSTKIDLSRSTASVPKRVCQEETILRDWFQQGVSDLVIRI